MARSQRRLPWGVGLACLAVAALSAAEHRGTVRFSGLAVPGATVTMSRGATKLAAVTDAHGLYRFPEVDEGLWSIQIECPGFVPIRQDIDGSLNAPGQAWDLKLRPIEDLREAAGLSAKAASGPPAPGKPAKENRPVHVPSGFQKTDLNQAAGAVWAQDAAQADPEPNSESAPDAFTVNGSASSGIETRSIGNARRGPARLYTGGLNLTGENSALNARPFSLTGQDTPRPGYNNMRLGAYVGGPLIIPHLTRGTTQFFVAYQTVRKRDASTQTALVPTPAMRDGDLSQVLDWSGQHVQIYDPATGMPFPQRRVLVSPQARALLALYPEPNVSSPGAYNYQAPTVNRSKQDDVQARIARQLGSKAFLNGAFAWRGSHSESPNLFGFTDTNSLTGVNVNANVRLVFRPSLNMNLGVQHTRSAVRLTPFSHISATCLGRPALPATIRVRRTGDHPA